MNRRQFLGIASFSLTLSGCANSPVGKTVAAAFSGNTGTFPVDYPQQLPYASITVSRGNAPQALLILAKVDGNELHWFSADRSVLVTRNGRLTRTVGLPTNLLKTTSMSEDPLVLATRNGDNEQVHSRLIDLSPGNRFGIVIESQLTRVGRENISILDRRHAVTRFIERCHAKQLGWKFENIFWIGDDGQVWRSQQHIAPDSPVVEIALAKPYQG